MGSSFSLATTMHQRLAPLRSLKAPAGVKPRLWLRRCLATGVTLWIAALGTVAHSVNISLDNNLYMGAWSPFATSYEITTPVCTWTDEQSSAYQIIASNNASIGSFNLVNSTSSQLPFSVFWQDDLNPLIWNQLQPDVASSETYLFDSAEQCGGGANTAMKIEVAKIDFDNAATGIYTGMIVLTLLPQ